MKHRATVNAWRNMLIREFLPYNIREEARQVPPVLELRFFFAYFVALVFMLPTTHSASSVGVYVNLTSSEFRLINHPVERSNHQKLPMVGETNIEVMRKVDAIYVDKTEFVQKLMQSSTRYVLLVRPRYFGKTFFINNLWYILEGKRQLFADCHISREGSQYAWTEYVVLRFILTAADSIKHFNNRLMKYATIHDVRHLTANHSNEAELAPEFIGRVVEQIRVKNNKAKEVVVLIDEYDRPLKTNVDKHVYRYFLRLFAVLQRLTEDGALRFVFLTGGNKINLFSNNNATKAANIAEDISLDQEYASVCGFTEDEVRKYFGGCVRDIATKYSIEENVIYEEMRAWYYGYRFSSKPTTVYNPASIIGYLKNEDHFARLKNYWVQTVDHPKTVLEAMTQERLRSNQSVVDLRARYKSEHLLNEVNTTHLDLKSKAMEPLLFQHGYLTIDDVDDREGYALRLPNKEVESAFIHGIALAFRTTITEREYNDTRIKMIDALQKKDIDSMIEAFNGAIRKSSLRIETEKGAEKLYRQSLFLAFFILDPKPENCNASYRVLTTRRETLKTNVEIGHVDVLVIETTNFVYLIGTTFQGNFLEAFGKVSEYVPPPRAKNDTRWTIRLGLNFLNDASIDNQNWTGVLYENTVDGPIPVRKNVSVNLIEETMSAFSSISFHARCGVIFAEDMTLPIDRGMYIRTLNNFDKMLLDILQAYRKPEVQNEFLENFIKNLANYKRNLFIMYSDITHMGMVLQRTMKRYGLYAIKAKK